MSLKLRDGVWHWRKMIDGHPFSKSTKTADKKVAEKMALLWEARAVQELMVSGLKPVTVHAAIDAYLAERIGRPGHYSSSNHLKRFKALPNVRMNELTLEQVQGILTKMQEDGLSHNTRVVAISNWNGVVNMCATNKWTAGPKLPRVKPEKTRHRYLTQSEEAAILRELDPERPFRSKNHIHKAQMTENHDLFVCLMQLGCRYNELARMQWNQVDLVSRKIMMIRIKRGVDNTLMMSDKLHAVLSRRHANRINEWVFPTKTKRNDAGKWLTPALVRAGIDVDLGKITLHTTRHTNASRMLQNGLSLLEVKELLGHASLASTMVYAHIETGAVAEKAASIMNKY